MAQVTPKIPVSFLAHLQCGCYCGSPILDHNLGQGGFVLVTVVVGF